MTEERSVHAFGFLTGLLVATVAALVLALLPSPADAAEEPFKVEFDRSEMRLGLLSDLPLDQVASTASLEGTIDETGKVTVPKGNFRLPELGITEPVTVKLFMGIESDATGTFDRQSGELVLNAKAGVWLSVNLPELLAALEGFGIDIGDQLGPLAGLLGTVREVTCGFSPMDVTFTTGSTSLGSGQPFTRGPLGPGAITAEWSKLGPFAGKTKVLGLIDVCQAIKMYAPDLVGGLLPEGTDLGGFDIDALLDLLDEPDLGPSSLTLTRSIDENPPPPPPTAKPKLKLTVAKPKRRLRAGRQGSFVVKVRNVGKAAATGVKVCARVRGGLKVQGKLCRRLGKVVPGATQTRRFRVKSKRRAGKVRFSVRLRAANAAGTRAAARLRVRR